MSPDFRSLPLRFPEFWRVCRFISLKLRVRVLVLPNAASLTHSGYHCRGNSCRGNKATSSGESSYLKVRHVAIRGLRFYYCDNRRLNAVATIVAENF